MKTFVIGDIHGCYNELIELLQQMNVEENDLVISLGDILDRGPKSFEVYNFFRSRKNAHVLMGNHERKHLNGMLNYAQEIVKIQFGNEYESLISWIKALPYHYELEEALIVHAAFEHDQVLEKQREDVLCGSTSGERYLEKKYPENTFWSDFYSGEKTIVYGHHVVGDSPKFLNNTLGIDTGCCHGGKLTAVEFPGSIIHQVQSEKNYWKEQQLFWQLKVLAEKPCTTMTFSSIDKLILKLRISEREDVHDYLNAIEEWKDELDNLLLLILEAMNNLVAELTSEDQENFNQVASTYFFKTFLFKAKLNKLTMDELKEKLETPIKRIELAEALNVSTKHILLPTTDH